MKAAFLLPMIAALLMGCGQKPASQPASEAVASQGSQTSRPTPPRGSGASPQAGATTQTTQPQKQPEQLPPQKQTTEPEGANAKTISGVARVMERPQVRNDLGQLAKFYLAYQLETNGPVRDVTAFKNSIRRDARKIVDQMDAYYYVIVPNLRNPGSNVVIVYERLADINDQHIVAMGDGSIQQMGTQQLRAALKGQ